MPDLILPDSQRLTATDLYTKFYQVGNITPSYTIAFNRLSTTIDVFDFLQILL